MKKLTKAEEEVMQYIWQLERCTVSQMLDEMGPPKPPHSSISSIVRILERKGFVDHKAYGRTYEYFPLVSKADYSKRTLHKFVQDYFNGSVNQLVSFLAQEEKISIEELEKLLDEESDE